MPVEYTAHAEENIRKRRLDKRLIERVLKNPDKIFDSRFGRKIAQKVIEMKLLRIVFEQKDGTYIVITADYTEIGRYR